MSSTKKDKALQDFESQFREVSKQLADQLKCFDSRTESKVLALAEFQEFYKKLGEVELEYARSLEKVAERFQDKLQRLKSQRKDKMNTVDIFSRILTDLKTKAKVRTFLSSRLTENVANRFSTIIEDAHRVNKKCRETAMTLQDEFTKQLHELSEKLRRYHFLQTESKLAESKLKSAEGAQQKLQAPRKRGSVKRAKNADKLREKCHARYTDNKLKAMRARNEYILSLEATNALTKKYFDQDIYDILECYDHNYQQAFQRAMDHYIGMETQASKLLQKDLSSLKDSVKAMNTENERLRLASDAPHTFQFSGKFVFISHSDDEVCQITAQERDTLDKQHSDVEERLKIAKSETEEINKSLEAAKDTLRTTYSKADQELNAGFDKSGNGGNESSANKTNREEVENYYLAKFKELIMTSSVRTRLQAQYNALMNALGGTPGKRPPQLPFKPTGRSHAMMINAQKKYQLFGSKLEDYVKVTGRPVPEIVESCVRFITKFGMEHQGIFRVPGSSTEINDMKEAFESGRDPLAGLNHWKDINAVAGVLRLYFRELQDPLFPKAYYQEFIDASRIYDSEEQARALSHVIKKLPDAVVFVMRYLFKFLHSVTKYKEENKMDAHNLAVVFGPTLIRVSEEDDMISSQGHFNKVLETIIKAHDVVFYDGELDNGDDEEEEEQEEEEEEEAQQTEDDISRDEAEESDSEDEVEPKDAKALYNYTARSSKELTFNRGDVIQVYKRSNNDWWDGCLEGVDGYVPCAYVRLLDDDNIDATSLKGSPPESRKKPDSLLLERVTSSSEGEVVTSPPSTRTTPITTPTAGYGYRPGISGDEMSRGQMLLRHIQKSTTPEVIPEDHMSSFKRSSIKRSDSPSKSPSNSLERSRSLGDRSSPKLVEDGNKTTSLPRSSALWQRRGQVPGPMSPVESRGVAEGMMSPSSETSPPSFGRAPPPKPKPKPKVPKRRHPSTELIASLQAGTAAQTARRDSHEEIPPDVDTDLPPPPPPSLEREVIGGELPSPPQSPVSKQDTFL